MKAHINDTTNPEPLKHLQDLLSEGNDAKILNFVKTVFAEQLPTYLNMVEKVAQVEIGYKEMRLENLKYQAGYNTMQKEHQELTKRIDIMIKENKERRKQNKNF